MSRRPFFFHAPPLSAPALENITTHLETSLSAAAGKRVGFILIVTHFSGDDDLLGVTIGSNLASPATADRVLAAVVASSIKQH